MVRMIAEVKGHRIVMIPRMTSAVAIMKKIPGKMGKLVEKAFGDATYEMSMSEYKDNYRIVGLKESIRRTEG